MTATTKHTPGPWRYELANASPTTGEHLISGGKPGYLAEVRDCGSGCVKANARLIAAAPDLLEVLDACEGHLAFDVNAGNGNRELLASVRAALAKARGEG